MKKIIKILILIFCIALLLYIIFNIWQEFNSQNLSEEKNLPSNNIPQCSFPREHGLNLCCYENNEWKLCNDKKLLKCGDDIRIMMKLDASNYEDSFYMCLKEGFIPIIYENDDSNWSLIENDSAFVCWTQDDSLDPIDDSVINIMLNGTISDQDQSGKLLEVLSFPVEEYSSVQDLIADENNAEIILNIEKEILCE